MRLTIGKLAVALGIAAVVLLAGGLAWKAEALTWNSATTNLPGVVKNYLPIDRIACCGWGALSSPLPL